MEPLASNCDAARAALAVVGEQPDLCHGSGHLADVRHLSAEQALAQRACSYDIDQSGFAAGRREGDRALFDGFSVVGPPAVYAAMLEHMDRRIGEEALWTPDPPESLSLAAVAPLVLVCTATDGFRHQSIETAEP